MYVCIYVYFRDLPMQCIINRGLLLLNMMVTEWAILFKCSNTEVRHHMYKIFLSTLSTIYVNSAMENQLNGYTQDF